jgi:hypothetical protein
MLIQLRPKAGRRSPSRIPVSFGCFGAFDSAQQSSAHKLAEAQALLPGDLAGDAAKPLRSIYGNAIRKPAPPVVEFEGKFFEFEGARHPLFAIRSRVVGLRVTQRDNAIA